MACKLFVIELKIYFHFVWSICIYFYYNIIFMVIFNIMLLHLTAFILQTHYHRRTESFDLGKNYIHQNRSSSIEKSGGNGVVVVVGSNSGVGNVVVPTAGRSPILQKNIGYQNLKAIECGFFDDYNHNNCIRLLI